MRSALITLSILALAVGCADQSQNKPDPIVAKRNYDAPIAGKTLTCAVDGPATSLAFGNEGEISGRLMGAEATGSWYARSTSEVEVYVDAGSISIRDVLKGAGGTWSGRNIRCG